MKEFLPKFTILYSESISYESPLSARQSGVERVWNAAGSAGRIVENAGYAYDYSGRLTGMSGSRNASYRYDVGTKSSTQPIRPSPPTKKFSI
ncbi:hypothetical protein [uncultured Fibrobacter sp.]|uniref:hypothetical protein n=1 Tax=uncultured Fibrobacter sp. TaxID=261512 RepID=UPI002804453C|nr:hypothetical protein [uncultured Fibrobacter sp.]